MKPSDLRHCTADELLDVAEGLRSESDVPHFEGCRACRADLSDVRSALGLVRSVSIPEPSPLFWDHLSQRIRQAVEHEGHPTLRRGRGWWPTLPIAAAAGLLMFAVTASWRPSAPPETRQTAGRSAQTAVAAPATAVVDDAGDESSVDFMAQLASALDQDAIEAIGIGAPPGTADLVLAELSSDEQAELARLLHEAMGKPGA